jgi:hypothetical protein
MDHHPGGDQFVSDMSGRTGISGPGGDARSLGENVVPAVSDLAKSSCRLTTRTVVAADSHTGHRLGTSGENVVPSVSDLTKLRKGLDKIALLGRVPHRGAVKG